MFGAMIGLALNSLFHKLHLLTVECVDKLAAWYDYITLLQQFFNSCFFYFYLGLHTSITTTNFHFDGMDLRHCLR